MRSQVNLHGAVVLVQDSYQEEVSWTGLILVGIKEEDSAAIGGALGSAEDIGVLVELTNADGEADGPSKDSVLASFEGWFLESLKIAPLISWRERD